mmetsp:Transcript_37972/g.43605  ORF Transcript_37972/g.43605 Transcript_37972/m.43605 type:complete len:108 (-) Transcript_37972:181-504(-)
MSDKSKSGERDGDKDPSSFESSKQEESKEKLFEINKMQFSENKPIRSLRDNDESFDRRRRENLELKNSGSMLYKLDASEFIKQETEVHTDKQMNESSVCLKQESESK